MYRIALCDDEAEELNKTLQILENYEKEHAAVNLDIESFTDADSLLELIGDEKYMPDLIIMDIYMPRKTGIEAARKLREMGCGCRIIFLTTSKEHALDAFGVEAAQYLVKPVSGEVLQPLLERFVQQEEEARRRYLLLRVEGSIRRVAVNDIIYCEAQGKTQCLHFTDGSKCIQHITMAEIWEMLSQYCEFVRCGIAYIVNLEHVEGLSRRELLMDNGDVIYPPRGAFMTLRERYFEYYCEEES